MGSSKLHVAILSSPGMGHLFPVLALGNRLATHHDVKVTVLALTTASSPAETQVLRAAMQQKGKRIDIVPIPPADVSGLIDSTTKAFTLLRIMVREALPAIRSAIANMNRRPDVLVADLFCTRALAIADEFKIPRYVHHPSNAWSAALMTYTQVLDKEINGEYVDQTEPLRIPGCRSVRPEDVVDPMEDRSDEQYREWMNQGIEYGEYSDGILINTWEDAESFTLKAMRENEYLRAVVKVPIYPIGPLRRQPDDDYEVSGDTQYEVMQWLDRQPLQSVLYVSFGSGGALSAKQITELAWGLELSRQQFLWVVQPPSETASDASFFTAGQGGDGGGVLDYLPEGFISRVQNLGFIVPLWAKQVKILSHPSIGGFLTHCGWNSILESVTSGVAMIAWPLYAEQRMNAAMLAEELAMAVRPATKKVVGREEIEEMVRRLMESEEGKAMRERVKKLKKSAENCVSKGGSSYDSMCEFLNDVKIKMSQLLNHST